MKLNLPRARALISYISSTYIPNAIIALLIYDPRTINITTAVTT